MALSVETGQFAASTGGATTTVTTGFQFKCVILFMTGVTANNSNGTPGSFSIGFSDGTNHRSVSWAGDSAVSTSNVGKSWRTDGALDYLSNGNPTSTRRVTGVAFNSTPNMVITWDGTPASAYLVGYIGLGGSDITNVIVGTHSLTTSTGAQSVTGLAFKPDFGMWIGAMMTAAGASGAGAEASCCIGFAKDSTHEFSMACGVDDAQTMAANVNGVTIEHNDATLSGITLGGQTEDLLADFTSFNTDGYTLNVSNAPASAYQFGYLLVKGGQWDVGASARPTTATTQTVTGMSFQPSGLFLIDPACTANNTITSIAVTAVGGATSTSTETAATAMHNDSINTLANREMDNAKIITSSSGLFSKADFTSMNSDGWTITWDGGAGAPQEILGWWACAGNASGNVTVSPTGSSATFSITTPTISGGASFTLGAGPSGTFSTGTVTVTPRIDVFPSGSSGTFSAGTITVTGTALVSPTGSTGTFTVGSPTVSGGASVTLAGSSITSSVGTVTITGGATVLAAGAIGTFSIGSTLITGGAAVFPVGSQAVFSAGTVTISTGGGGSFLPRLMVLGVG